MTISHEFSSALISSTPSSLEAGIGRAYSTLITRKCGHCNITQVPTGPFHWDVPLALSKTSCAIPNRPPRNMQLFLDSSPTEATVSIQEVW